jgi:anti-sigma B factor antagonist
LDHAKLADEHNPSFLMSLEIAMLGTASGGAAGVVTVQLAGTLNTSTAPELESRLMPVFAGPVNNIVFDLARLKFISSAGLRVFGAARKALNVRGGQASFVNLQPQIETVFEVIKSLPGVAIYQNSADLDRYLALLQSGGTGEP